MLLDISIPRFTANPPRVFVAGILVSSDQSKQFQLKSQEQEVPRTSEHLKEVKYKVKKVSASAIKEDCKGQLLGDTCATCDFIYWDFFYYIQPVLHVQVLRV
ncbi:hypothetical protein CRENBAI_015257 [Crenichthys baileyi]|uniref:Uncharacterized protein n=1 Tax=Crenichthys baileyi TaxID=28760 RepID=A0AAV9SKE6_9TELE